MAGSFSKLASSIANDHSSGPPTQLWLIPAPLLHAVPPPTSEIIRLPTSILRIKADEQLADYLSRVAAAAMTAATKACGNPNRAALRLGTTTSDHETTEISEHSRPTLAFSEQ